MINEANLLGVYFSDALVAAVLGWVVLAILRRPLHWMGFYRCVWHPSLVDLALFGILWCLSARALPTLAGMMA
jgi:protein-S-isoprenylcysteine O-methyltransferase Ste14